MTARHEVLAPAGDPMAPTPPAPLTKARYTRRQLELLDGLEAILLARGLRVRITDVANELGASLSTLYQLAPSRDELVLVVIDRWYQRHGRAAMKMIETQQDPVARLETWLAECVLATQGVSLQFMEDLEQSAATRRLAETYNQYTVDFLELLLREGIEAGRLKPHNPALIAEAMHAASSHLQHADVLRRLGVSQQEASLSLRDLLLQGVLLQQPSKPAPRRAARLKAADG